MKTGDILYFRGDTYIARAIRRSERRQLRLSGHDIKPYGNHVALIAHREELVYLCADLRQKGQHSRANRLSIALERGKSLYTLEAHMHKGIYIGDMSDYKDKEYRVYSARCPSPDYAVEWWINNVLLKCYDLREIFWQFVWSLGIPFYRDHDNQFFCSEGVQKAIQAAGGKAFDEVDNAHPAHIELAEKHNFVTRIR